MARTRSSRFSFTTTSSDTTTEKPKTRVSISNGSVSTKRARDDEHEIGEVKAPKRVRVQEKAALILSKWDADLQKSSSDESDGQDEEKSIGTMTPSGKRRISMRDLAKRDQQERARRRSQAGGTPFRPSVAERRRIRASLAPADTNTHASHAGKAEDDGSYLKHQHTTSSSPKQTEDNDDNNQTATVQSSTVAPRSLFGSLKGLGSATIGRVRGAVSFFSPVKHSPKGSSPPTSSPTRDASQSPTPKISQTEGRMRRPIKHVRDIEYPTLPEQDTPSLAQRLLQPTLSERLDLALPDKEQAKWQYETDIPLDPDEEGIDNDERKRREFVRLWKKRPDSRFDYLHNIPLDDNLANFKYPMPHPVPNPRDDSDHYHDRAAMIPTNAELIGPNSHNARGTMAPKRHPDLQLKWAGVPLPAISEQYSGKNWAVIGSSRKEQKRKLEEVEDNQEVEGGNPSTPSRTFTVEDVDEMDGDDIGIRSGLRETADKEPSTPDRDVKRRKVTIEDDTESIIAPAAPRSILKTPGSVKRVRGRVDFTPTNTIRHFTSSHAYGSTPAGVLAPDSMWDNNGNIKGTPESDTSSLFNQSPNTAMNTANNTGLPRSVPRQHPGDVLAAKIPGTGFIWSDPNDPLWKPSLGNPKPGMFTCNFDDDEEEDLSSIYDPFAENKGNQSQTATSLFGAGTNQKTENVFDQQVAPVPPKSPRPAHATLPTPVNTSFGSNVSDTSSTGLSSGAFEAANLERKRQEASKTKPKHSSRLSEVTSTRSRSPSPPADDVPALDTTATTPPSSSPTEQPTTLSAFRSQEKPVWTFNTTTNEYTSSDRSHPTFTYNVYNELIPSVCLRTNTGAYDDTLIGPDDFTERTRQQHYMQERYSPAWARVEYPFDEPQTYEEAGVGDTEIHRLIDRNDARSEQMVRKSDARFRQEWDEHADVLSKAEKDGDQVRAVFIRDEDLSED